MKRGQQTCKEPKCRQCALITGNRNVSGLMSVCFYLEMKMHLCCPDPIFLSISEQKCDTSVHAHTHIEGSSPQQKELPEKGPHRCVYLETGRGAEKRHLPLGRAHGELCDEVLCLCLWGQGCDRPCTSTPGDRSAFILANREHSPPPAPFHG